MILKEKTINPKFRKRIFMKMESENTLGPAGPPLQMPASKLSSSSRVRELRAAQSSSLALDPSPLDSQTTYFDLIAYIGNCKSR